MKNSYEEETSRAEEQASTLTGGEPEERKESEIEEEKKAETDPNKAKFTPHVVHMTKGLLCTHQELFEICLFA